MNETYYGNEVEIPKELRCLFYKMKYTDIAKLAETL